MRYYARDRDAAREAWQTSLGQVKTPWATRNLAVLAGEDNQLDEAADLYRSACRMRPSLLPLVVECGQALLKANRHDEWLDLLAEFPDSVRTAGRVRLLEGQAALALRDLDRVAEVLDSRAIIDDLREGERSLSNLWFEFH